MYGFRAKGYPNPEHVNDVHRQEPIKYLSKDKLGVSQLTFKPEIQEECTTGPSNNSTNIYLQ